MAAPRVAPRRLLIASVAFGVFVLLDIALFGWLIFRSLSQREVEKVLLETREEAEAVAAQLAGAAERQGRDLFTAIATERMTVTSIDSLLRQRELVRQVEIRDPNGVLVYTSGSHEAVIEEPGQALLPDSPELRPQGKESETVEERHETFEVPDIEVPIGKFGTLQIGISPKELAKRITVLRGDLIREASVIGVVTAGLLMSAYLIIWLLYRRGRRLEEQAAEAERMAYIGTLASGLAHEIRNPLNSLNLNMQMLEEELRDGSGAGTSGRLMSITRSELSRLERLVTDFLAYARPRPLELEEIAARDLLERVREVLAGAARTRGARIEIEDSTAGARLRVDGSQINQLLLNLANNALAATAGSARRPVVRLGARRQGAGTAVLEVEDNGVGIAAEDRERIFDLFYSTRKGGTGLGLAIVQRIAQNHHGRVEVASELGRGTTISVVLPEAVVEEAPARTPVALERAAVP
jgi:signal transduction histidine kinase